MFKILALKKKKLNLNYNQFETFRAYLLITEPYANMQEGAI